MQFTAHTITHALQTLRLINQRLEADQCATFRRLLRETMPKAEDAYSADSFPFRTHLGASLIGRECDRDIWYGWRWAVKPAFNGRMLLLFNRGHLEEQRIVALLQMIGCTVWTHDGSGKQFRVSAVGGHFGGSLDGVIRGIPEMATESLLVEFKTHSAKSFAKLAGDNWSEYAEGRGVFTGKGVRAAKPEHYVQTQTYAAAYGLPCTLYCAVNKDTDALYIELVKTDNVTAQSYGERARTIITSDAPPARIKDDPTWFTCKFCDKARVCYGKDAPERNCRTCQHGRAEVAGGWYCMHPTHSPRLLDKHAQLAGCPLYTRDSSLRE
jgi:hypothetical protein